jgi:hypothetical protein
VDFSLGYILYDNDDLGSRNHDHTGFELIPKAAYVDDFPAMIEVHNQIGKSGENGPHDLVLAMLVPYTERKKQTGCRQSLRLFA